MEENVKKFLSESGSIIATSEADCFEGFLWCEVMELGITSPIEKMFYIAFKTVARFHRLPEAQPINIDGKKVFRGLGIDSQFKIGKYRCDFRCYWDSNNGSKAVLVECDSQEFHERNESERRYEKRRDRFLNSEGHLVMHFTGKEIIEKPYLVASEVISSITSIPLDEVYDPNYLRNE